MNLNLIEAYLSEIMAKRLLDQDNNLRILKNTISHTKKLWES